MPRAHKKESKNARNVYLRRMSLISWEGDAKVGTLVTLEGKEVAISGSFYEADMRKADVALIVREMKATPRWNVRASTDVLIRGISKVYKYGDYGVKERWLAENVPGAVVIELDGLLDLYAGQSTPCWPPNQPAPARPRAAERSGVFIPHDTNIKTKPAKAYERDPDEVDRSLRGHAVTLNLLAEFVRTAGFAPLKESKDCRHDLAWNTSKGTFVAEVKSLTGWNETAQIRLGLGQVLDYRHALKSQGKRIAGTVLAIESAPSETRWIAVCEAAGVTLVWPETMPSLFAKRVRPRS
jgi:hypothetical protein